jgi:hypothetical protein
MQKVISQGTKEKLCQKPRMKNWMLWIVFILVNGSGRPEKLGFI